MINIQDLKIGNILQRIDVQGKMSPCVVMQIGKKSFGVLQDGLNYGILDLKECSPIPLTQKAFLDSGFKHIKGSAIVIFEKGDFSVEVHLNAKYAEMKFCFKNKVIPCKSTIYVHDLQNAVYQATGENLKIVIK